MKPNTNTVPILEAPPSPRPTCPGCGDTLRPTFKVVNATGEDIHGGNVTDRRPAYRVWTGWRSYGHFHSQDCATRWANEIWSEILRKRGKDIPPGVWGWGAGPRGSAASSRAGSGEGAAV